MKKLILPSLLLLLSCANAQNYSDVTVPEVDLKRYLGTWHVWAGKLTFLEKGAHNAKETYTWNESKKRIDVDFTMRKDSFTGPVKSYPQKAWIADEKTKAHWKIQFFWPLKFDYLIAYLAPDYSATIVIVPSKKYIWLMGRSPKIDPIQMAAMKEWLAKNGVAESELTYVPQQ
jgi:apolipoprotein D and lipocalin family protein